MAFLTVGYRLKSLAVELDVSVLVLSHAPRYVERRENKRPQLADLRKDCPLIERNVDVVMFLYRDDYYLEMSQPEQRSDETLQEFEQRYDDWLRALEGAYKSAECIVARNNYGSVGTVKLRFDHEFVRFDNLASQ